MWGCRIALDNCRSGLDIFELLHQWPVSCIKIDGSLIRHMDSSARADSLVRAIAQMAAGRGIESVAEQVESQLICDKLSAAGLDYAQGFYLAKPQPLDNLFN